MSETPSGNDKFIVHSNGHIKRLDASTLNGDYAFNVSNGNITMKQVETDITTSSFKDSNKKPLNGGTSRSVDTPRSASYPVLSQLLVSHYTTAPSIVEGSQ